MQRGIDVQIQNSIEKKGFLISLFSKLLIEKRDYTKISSLSRLIFLISHILIRFILTLQIKH